jgi:hypothetical protein
VDGLHGTQVEKLCECINKVDSEVLSEVRRSSKRTVWVRMMATCDAATVRLRSMVRAEDILRIGDLSGSEIATLCRYKMWKYAKIKHVPAECAAVFAAKKACVCPLYVSALAHLARHFKEEGSHAEVTLKEKPDGLVKLFVEGVLVKIEVRLCGIQICAKYHPDGT